MGCAHVTANVVTFNAAMSACEKGGQWQHALLLLKDMGCAHVTANVITFNAAM